MTTIVPEKPTEQMIVEMNLKEPDKTVPTPKEEGKEEPLNLDKASITNLKKFANDLYAVFSSNKKEKPDFLEAFFGTKAVFTFTVTANPLEEGNFGINIPIFLEKEGFKTIKFHHINGEDYKPIKHSIEVEIGKKIPYFYDTIYFLEKENEKYAVTFRSYGYSGQSRLEIQCLDEKKAEILFNNITKYIDENNIFKNKKIHLTSYDISPIKYPKVEWKDVILRKETENDMKVNLINWINSREKFKEVMPWKRGVILEGFPGTGKTTTGKYLCNYFEGTLIWVTSKNAQNPEYISYLFEFARKLCPTLIFFEDIDFIANSRYTDGRREVLGELLNQLDGFESNDGVLVVATTNDANLLDSAISQRPGRFDIKIKLPLPEKGQVKDIMKLNLKKEDTFTEEDLDEVSEKLVGYTPAYIKEIVYRSRSTKFANENKLFIDKNDILAVYKNYPKVEDINVETNDLVG